MAKIAVPTSGTRPIYGGNVRISDDPEVLDPKTGELRRLEKGIARQKEDILAEAEKLGVEIGFWYEENDVSAFKKKRIVLPNGRSAWRVIRPDFREMLADYEDGTIDGIIYYDLDRMTRQPRDLEDQIDLVEYYKRPVETVTGQMDLRTSSGRAMARVMVAMANKASEDTSRRVARARLQQAQEGVGRTFRSRRPFGYNPDGSLNSAEANLVREAARKFLAGESWGGVVRLFNSSGIKPVTARVWSAVSIKQILLSPAVAGIAIYNGALRVENQQGGPLKYAFSDPMGMALKNAQGEYLKGQWDAILSVEQWEAVVSEQDRRKQDGRGAFGGAGTRKYLLSGLLRCGRVREDGSVCHRSLIGSTRKLKSGNYTVNYKCATKTAGGCSGTSRNVTKLDKLVEDLLFAHIAENAPAEQPAAEEPDDSPEVAELAEVRRKIALIREGYPEGTVSDESYFVTLPKLEARERKLQASVNADARERAGRAALRRSAGDVRREWDDADLSGRRAILAKYLNAVVVKPSKAQNRWHFDHEAIVPVWKDATP